MRNFIVGLITFFSIVACFLFQLNVLNELPLFGVVANIGIVFIVSLGILAGEKIGVTIGLSYGLIVDIFFGKSLGIYSLLFLLVGFFCGKISYSFSKDNKFSIIMISAAVTFIYEIICYLFFVVAYGYELMILSTIIRIVLESVYNIFIASVFFKPFSFLSDIINKSKLMT